MKGYEVKIGFCSRELTAKERIMLKDTTNAVKIDEATRSSETGSIVIDPDYYAELIIHNEKAAGDPDYTQAVIVDMDGVKYVTGSASFWEAFQSIADEMRESGEDEPWKVSVYRVPSKNYKDKDFITCSVI